jgi:hypothetical protein
VVRRDAIFSYPTSVALPARILDVRLPLVTLPIGLLSIGAEWFPRLRSAAGQPIEFAGMLQRSDLVEAA